MAYIIGLFAFCLVVGSVSFNIKTVREAVEDLALERPFSEECPYPTNEYNTRTRINNYELDEEVWYLDNNEVKQGYFKDVVVRYEVYEDDRRYFTDFADNIYQSKEALFIDLTKNTP